MNQLFRAVTRLSGPATISLAAALALSGCAGGSTQQTKESLDFSFSYPATQGSPYAELARKYMDGHPDIKVTLSPVPSESYDSLLRTALQGGNASDVIMATPGSGTNVSLISLAKADLLAPLADNAGKLVPEPSKPLFYLDGKIYGQPTDISVTGTIFNSSAGQTYPETTADLATACRALATSNSSFFALAGSIPINTGIAAVSMAATNVYAKTPDWDRQRAEGKTTFAGTTGWRETLQLFIDLKKDGCFQPGVEGSGFDAIVGGLGKGSSLSAFVPGGAAKELQQGMKGAKLVVQAFPHPADGSPFIFASSDFSLAISKASTHQNGAQAFLDWFAQPEQASRYAELAGSLPVTGVKGLDLSNSPYAAVAPLLAEGKYTTMPVNTWTKPAVFNTLGTGVQGLLTGQKTVDGLLQELDKAWDE